MKKEIIVPTPQDSDTKFGKNHKSNRLRDVKDLTNVGDVFFEDKRKDARQEHTNHFTNREGHGEKK